MMRIFLIGYMGSGKTTFGKKLARKMGLTFLDLDELIVNQTEKSIETIFKESGEIYFRDLERKTLLQILSKKNILVSTGGGTPCFSDNLTKMNEVGTTIYLQISAKGLYSRLINAKDQRPIIKDKTESELLQFIEEHLEEREPFYTKAKLTINGLKLSSSDLDQISQHIKTIKAEV